MKPDIKIDGLDGFEHRLIALAEMPGIDAALLQAAEQFRAQATSQLRAQAESAGTAQNRRLQPDDLEAIGRAIDIQPDKSGGYQVTSRHPLGRALEFGSEKLPETSWFSRTIAMVRKDIVTRFRALYGNAHKTSGN